MNQGIDIYDVHFDGKEVPKQGRSFVVGKEDGTIFVSPAFAGVGDIEAIMCASYDGVSVIYEDEILYCPIDWLIKEFPKHAEDMKRTRKKMREIANGEHGPPRNEE